MQSTNLTSLNSRLLRMRLWSLSSGKRFFDLAGAVLVLTAASPIMVMLALAVKASSRGPFLFRQNRVGRNGPLITRSGDRRVTWMGKWLRKWKLDELPQFLNVVSGDMSLVGPRPDMSKYMGTLTGNDRNILYFRPGITSPATLKFRNEEEELAKVPAEELEQFYINNLLPQKIRTDLDYVESATFSSDCRILWRTFLSILK